MHRTERRAAIYWCECLVLRHFLFFEYYSIQSPLPQTTLATLGNGIPHTLQQGRRVVLVFWEFEVF